MAIDLQTRFELMDLHARYAFTIDLGDPEGWAACFTPDGVMETSRPIIVTGHAELLAFAQDRASTRPLPARHVTWHHVFDRDPELDEVHGSCSAAILETSIRGVRALFTASYNDVFVRVNQTWLLERRSVLIDHVLD